MHDPMQISEDEKLDVVRGLLLMVRGGCLEDLRIDSDRISIKLGVRRRVISWSNA